MPPLDWFLDKVFGTLEQVLDADAVPPRYLALLQEAQRQPLPPELAAPTPRPDVWGTRGYLSQPRYEALYKPLLIHGEVTRGIVYRYSDSGDSDGRDVSASYAWLAGPGHVRTEHLKESYDPLHAAYGAGQGDMLLDVDASMELGRVLTIFHEGGRHVIYEALRTGRGERPEPRSESAADPTQDWEELSGRYALWWKVEGEGPVLHLGRDPSLAPMALVLPDASEPGAWRLIRTVPLPERPWLRIVPAKAAGAAAAWHIVGESGREVGQAKTRGERLFVSAGGRTLMVSPDGRGGWTAENVSGQEELAGGPSGEGRFLLRHCKEHRRLFVESLLLALAAAGRPWFSGP